MYDIETETITKETTTETVKIGYDDIIELLKSKGIETEDKEIIIENALAGMKKHYSNDGNKMTITLKSTKTYIT